MPQTHDEYREAERYASIYEQEQRARNVAERKVAEAADLGNYHMVAFPDMERELFLPPSQWKVRGEITCVDLCIDGEPVAIERHDETWVAPHGWYWLGCKEKRRISDEKARRRLEKI